MQFSGGCMIGWWCQGQVRKQYFQHGEGLVATFLSNPFNQLQHSSYCLNLHHNLENRATESVIRSAQFFGSICEKKLHFGIDWFWFWRHSQQLGKPIGALIVSSRFHLHFLPKGSQFQQLYIAGVHTICGICYLRSILAPWPTTGWAPFFWCFFAVIRKIKLYISWSAKSVNICKEEGKSCSLGSIAIAIANIGVKVVQDLIVLCGPWLIL